MDPVLAFLQSLPTDQIALGGLVTYAVLSLLRGWVVPRSVLIDRMADKDERIKALEKERDAWHTAHDVSEAGRAELKTQNSSLLKSTEISTRFMESARAWFERDSRNAQREIEGIGNVDL